MSQQQPEILIASSIEKSLLPSDETPVYDDDDDFIVTNDNNDPKLLTDAKERNSDILIVANDDTTSETTTTKTSIVSDSVRSDGTSSSSSVSFGSVHVREHRMTLGRNPGVGYGVPVELAWDVVGSNEFTTIEEYEENVRQSHGQQYRVPTPPPPQQQNDDDDDTPTTNNNNSSKTEASIASADGSITADSTSTSTTPITSNTTTTTPTPRIVKRIPASKRDEIASMHHSRASIVRIQDEVKTIQEQRSSSKSDTVAKKIIQELKRNPNGIVNTSQQSFDYDMTTDTTAKKQKSWWSYCCP
jgi:hypothetical protein